MSNKRLESDGLPFHCAPGQAASQASVNKDVNGIMSEINKIKELMQTIIGMHESREFDALLPYISKSEIEKETWFTRKRFSEVCEAIENEIGKMTSLQYIDALKRKSSILTLWKANYSKTKDEVLWQVTFDAASKKVLLMHINWEHQVGLMG